MDEQRKALMERITEIGKFEEAPVQNSGIGIRPEKDPLNRFDGWDTAPDFLLKMVANSKDPQGAKGFMEQVIRELNMTPREQKKYLRPDPVSHAYRENYQELLREIPRLNVNPTGLTIEQILASDRLRFLLDMDLLSTWTARNGKSNITN